MRSMGKPCIPESLPVFFKKPDSPPNFRKYVFRLFLQMKYLKICYFSATAVFKALFGIRVLKVPYYFQAGRKYTGF